MNRGVKIKVRSGYPGTSGYQNLNKFTFSKCLREWRTVPGMHGEGLRLICGVVGPGQTWKNLKFTIARGTFSVRVALVVECAGFLMRLRFSR